MTAAPAADPGADLVAEPPRFFVPSGALADGALRVVGDDAAAMAARRVRVGDRIVALDGSGWAAVAVMTDVGPDACSGRVVERHLAPARRTKVSLHFSPMGPERSRALALQAAAAGVVSLMPVFTAASRVDLLPAEPAELAPALRAASEAAGWGRLPLLGDVGFLDQAVDRAARAGAAVLMAVPGGGPVAEALAGRPFTVALFCPTAGAFTPDELNRAAARGAHAVALEGGDAIAAALAALAAVYAALEPAPRA